MTNPTKLLRSSEITINSEIDWNDSPSVPVLKLLRLDQNFLMQR
ncbi:MULTISPECIES: hypothetical protein [unclassified Nostoc]|nr:hypothetical protein [Nostoc sp. S13]MDF5737667.1 hypothetical protein [Nostoc sp. S13]